MGKSELSYSLHFECFVYLWFRLCGIYYYANERCIKDQEGAKSVKQRYIVVLLIYTSDCRAVLTGLCKIHCVILMHFSVYLCCVPSSKKNAIKKGKWLILAQTIKKILLSTGNT